MAQVVVTYKTPKDPAAFDKYYYETHVPLVKAIPGLLKFELSTGPVVSAVGAPGIHRIAILHFADLATLGAGMESAEGKAAAADAAKFLGPDDSLTFFDTKEY